MTAASEHGVPVGTAHPLLRRIRKDRYLLLLLLPCVAYYFLFRYLPIWGIMISFKDYKPFIGFAGSAWVGLKYYANFFSVPEAWLLVRNTFLLGLYSIIWSFPTPILFALVLNEVRSVQFKKTVQTITYMPHFLSMVIVTGMVISFLSPVRGPLNGFLKSLGRPEINFFADPKYFRSIYIISGIWQDTGWGAIIYLAALSGINPELYESAVIDGANKLRQIVSITLPMMVPTITMLLLLRVGNVLDVGFEKAYLLQNPVIYETADVLSTYVYRQGIRGAQYSYASAIGTFNSVVSLAILLIANFVSRRMGETSLW
jgi:putative aldouronate transport system permease protein